MPFLVDLNVQSATEPLTLYDVADANAAHAKTLFPNGGAVHVPVWLFASPSNFQVDNGWFDAITQPGVAIADDDDDSYIHFTFSADDIASIYVKNAGAGTRNERVSFTSAVTVLNEEGDDMDFRVEGDTKTNLFIVDAGTDSIRLGDDDSYLGIGAGNDVHLLWSSADATDHGFVLALGDTSQMLHITDVGAKASDWAITSPTHPTVYVHSNTTPITDYVSIGGHDGTTAFINVVGGTTLAVQIAGTTEFNVLAGSINPNADDGSTLGTATVSWSDLFLASGGVINWANGNVTITQAAGSLKFDLGVYVFDQAALDTAIITLISSDVATGMTTLPLGPDVDAETFLAIGKASATLGGAHFVSVAESTATESLHIESWGGAPATTDTSASLGAINIFAGQHDNANADADMAANSNALVVGEIDVNGARLTRMLLKADDGELHLGNATLVALDDEDDMLLVRAMQKTATQGGIIETQDDNPFQNYDRLHELGIVGDKDASGFHLFALQPRLALHEGAMWQLFTDLMDMARALPAEIQGKLNERMRGRLALTT